MFGKRLNGSGVEATPRYGQDGFHQNSVPEHKAKQTPKVVPREIVHVVAYLSMPYMEKNGKLYVGSTFQVRCLLRPEVASAFAGARGYPGQEGGKEYMNDPWPGQQQGRADHEEQEGEYFYVVNINIFLYRHLSFRSCA